MNDKADCKTAPATPGLVNIYMFCDCSLLFNEFPQKNCDLYKNKIGNFKSVHLNIQII